MSKITYLFGAGASWESIPVVGELERAFQIVKEWNEEIHKSIPQKTSYSDGEKKTIRSCKTFDALLQTICFNTPIYKTIDTFAKKLTITDDIHDLHNVKAALSLFFTLWQESSIRDIEFELLKKNGRKFKEIDTRYFGLLTNYLQRDNGKIILDPNVNFISWNYDTQLERSLAFILDKSVNDIPNLFNIHPFNQQETPQIIHLNGVAGYYKTESNNANLFREKNPLGNRPPKEVLKDLVDFIGSVEKMSINVDEYFTFAWESDKINRAVTEAEKILSETDTLVIIGYSFPNFNNEIDKKLLAIFLEQSNRKNNLKVYYQDPRANKTLLSKRFGIDESIIEIDSTNMDQFILPLERIS